jgi:uncharacterized protein YkwD
VRFEVENILAEEPDMLEEMKAALQAGALVAIAGLACLGNRLFSAEARPPAVSAEQLRQISSLMTEFRKVRSDPERRLEVIDRAAETGPAAVKNLLEIVNKELGKQLTDYRELFLKAALQVVAKRTGEANLQEILELRNRVLQQAKNENLTKETIVSASDPALVRLKALILVDRQEILKQYPQLEPRREALKVLGEQWQRCGRWLVQEDEPAGAAVPAADATTEGVRETKVPSFAEYLTKEEEIAVALALPMTAPTRAVLAFNSQLAGRLDPEEARCVLDLNLTRNLLGLRPVQIDLALTTAARGHSADMERLNFFSHDSPVPGKTTPWDRARLAGTSASGENIAMGTIDGAVANEMWWHSPGHHRNMLGDHARVGVGRNGKYWTELFGK